MRGPAVVLFAFWLAACSPPASGNPPSTAAFNQPKGQPLSPVDFPAAPQSLSFSGNLNASVSSGRPQSCGFGSGPDNFMVFSYALYFQVGSSWYRFGADTDYGSGPYYGPGTYSARGSLDPIDGTGPRYQGRVQLVVRSDQPPDAGTVDGTLTTLDGGRVKVTGGWTCSPGPELGPA